MNRLIFAFLLTLPSITLATEIKDPTNLDCAAIATMGAYKSSGQEKETYFSAIEKYRNKAVKTGNYGANGFNEALIHRTLTLAHEIQEDETHSRIVKWTIACLSK